MKILDSDPDFDAKLEFERRDKRAIVLLLIDQIMAASDISELRFVGHCTDPNMHVVTDPNRICYLYFKLLENPELDSTEEDPVRLVNFMFKEVS